MRVRKKIRYNYQKNNPHRETKLQVGRHKYTKNQKNHKDKKIRNQNHKEKGET